MKRALVAMALVGVASPCLAKSPVDTVMAEQPSYVAHTSAKPEDIMTCMAGRRVSPMTTIPIDGGTRVVMQAGIAVIDLVKAGDGTDVTVRALFPIRGKTDGLMRKCAPEDGQQ